MDPRTTTKILQQITYVSELIVELNAEIASHVIHVTKSANLRGRNNRTNANQRKRNQQGVSLTNSEKKRPTREK